MLNFEGLKDNIDCNIDCNIDVTAGRGFCFVTSVSVERFPLGQVLRYTEPSRPALCLHALVH